MPLDSPPAAVPEPDLSTSVIRSPPGLLELFLAFAKMSLAGFGGVLYWARRGIVDQHRWMTADEFNATYALCHFLPGPNIVNLSMVFWVAHSRHCRGSGCLRRIARSANRHHNDPGGALRALWRDRRAPAHSGRGFLCRRRAADCHGVADD